MTNRVGPKGQVVIPKSIREELRIQPGDDVLVDRVDEEVRVRRVPSLDELQGIFRDAPGDALGDLEAEHRLEIERDEERIRRRSA